MSINELAKFVRAHTTRADNNAPQDGVVDVVFFGVRVQDGTNVKEFTNLVQGSLQGEFCQCNPFDGNAHSYMELGGWLGDQGLGLRFMGLAQHFKLATIFSAKTILPSISNEEAVELAGSGMLAIESPKPTA